MPTIIYSRAFCVASNAIFMTCANGLTRCVHTARVPMRPWLRLQELTAATPASTLLREVA